MAELAKRLDHFTESVIREMTRIAEEAGAINLAQGFADFEPPEELLQAAARALRSGCNQYSITWGARSFHERVENLVRLNFAKREETLHEVGRRLGRLGGKI